MGENAAAKHQQGFELAGGFASQAPSKNFDDEGRIKRTGGFQVQICGLILYFNLVGVAIGYSIAASISMMAIKKTDRFYEKGRNPRTVSRNPYMILYRVVEILLSQIPDFDIISWLLMVAAVMSFTYSTLGLCFGAFKFAENIKNKGTLTGIGIRIVTKSRKIWRTFQALGDIAFAYCYCIIIIEIQDTIYPPTAEYRSKKKATFISVVTTTIFYMFCRCLGYAAFRYMGLGSPLTGFGFYNPYWLQDIANAAIVIYLLGAYQVYCQPLFAFVENTTAKYFPESKLNKQNINLFPLVWRSLFVFMTTVAAMLMPFFIDVVGILCAFGFWKLTVYFPVEMYIVQKKIPQWSGRWVSLQILSVACLIISICAGLCLSGTFCPVYMCAHCSSGLLPV